MPIKEKKYTSRLTHLGELSVEQFLNEYWQQKPLYIKQAFPNFTPSVTADELAGLSLDEDVVSRLIIETKSTTNKKANSSWSLEHGPIEENRFSTLPESNWTLLIQHADQLDPGVNELLTAFRFIPNWRLDDIMVSYATKGGGVGPHFDYFDVFLLQASGKRRWRLGQQCDSLSPLISEQPMKILENFSTQNEFICEPGDLLYVPANLAHWGEAIEESMTYSIGFRAPSDAEFLLDFSNEVSQDLNEDQRYADPKLSVPQFSGEINQSAISNFKNKLKYYLDDDQKIANWLGRFATENQSKQENEDYFLYDPLSYEEYEILIKNKEIEDTKIKLANYHRCVYLPIETKNPNKTRTQVDKEITKCFINSEHYDCSIALSQHLSSYSHISLKELSLSEIEQLQPIVKNLLIEHIK